MSDATANIVVTCIGVAYGIFCIGAVWWMFKGEHRD